MSSVYLTGTVAGTYHGLSGFPDDPANPQQVVVTVQMRQSSAFAPFVRAVLWCGEGEAGERRAAEVRRVFARNTVIGLIGQALTYCARSNNLTVRGLQLIQTTTPSGEVVSFNSLRTETTEPTTTL
jgi:hypothetical protein